LALGASGCSNSGDLVIRKLLGGVLMVGITLAGDSIREGDELQLPVGGKLWLGLSNVFRPDVFL